MSTKILIVNDEPEPDSLTMLLQWYGLEVAVARSGKEALSMSRTLRPHAILLDVLMPGMDSYELSRQLRNEPWGNEVLLIALTEAGCTADEEMATLAGFDDYWTKPVQLLQLRDLFRRGPKRAASLPEQQAHNVDALKWLAAE